MRQLTRITVLILLVTLLAACGGDDSSSETEMESLPEARPLIDESATYIQNANSIELEMNVSGYPVSVEMDSVEMLNELPLFFNYARGIFLAPDRMTATIQFSLDALSTTAQLVALDRDHYFKLDMLGNRWFRGELIAGFSPASLMAQPGGVASALASVTDLTMVGRENLDGLSVFHLNGTIQASAVYALTFGLIRTKEGILNADIYIRAKNHQLAVLKLIEPPPDDDSDAENTTWTITIVDYNQAVSIDAPVESE
ncbi:MAG: LppX_LprAFG lipoprotein [Anaerolineae bacterium]|nr:LppX_LprAFG lipoprotein [Anaerolineae bacterium]